MNRPFEPELISAYLDGELPADERALVEAELAVSPAARQLHDELRALRGELQALPRTAASAGFADRVVAAALAAKQAPAKRPASESPVTSAPITPASRPAKRHWLPGTLVGVAALAAAVMLAVWIGGGPSGDHQPVGSNLAGSNTEIPDSGDGNSTNHDPLVPAPAESSATERALAQLRQASPQAGQAVVLRIRLPAGKSPQAAIDEALAAAKLGYRAPTDLSTGALSVASTYRQQVAEQFGGQQPGVPNPALQEGTIAAADAVFIEAAWDSLERAITALADEPDEQVEVAPLMHVAVAARSGDGVGEGEGEAGPRGAGENSEQFAQRLNPGMFRLVKETATVEPSAVEPGTSQAPVATPPSGQRRVRVLILVERASE
jgi:negative regulator of sigma E activity